MHTCSNIVGMKRRLHASCCYGAQGCTLAPSAATITASREEKSSGTGPKQEPPCEQPSRGLSVNLSPDAELQDCYLLAQALSEGGFEVSVTVQATPPSAPSPSDTAEQSTSETEVSREKRLLRSLVVQWLCLISTMDSSQLTNLYRE